MFFFVNVGPSYIPESNVTSETYLNESIHESFFKANITPDIILETVSKLKPKNSSGKDNISTKLLKEIIDCINYPIAHLFHLFFKQDTSLASIHVTKLFPSSQRTKKRSLIITDIDLKVFFQLWVSYLKKLLRYKCSDILSFLRAPI